MARYVIVHAIVLGLLAGGCSVTRTRAYRPESPAPLPEGAFHAGAMIPAGSEETLELPPPVLPAEPIPVQGPTEEQWTHKVRRQSRRALRGTADFMGRLALGAAIGFGIAAGLVLALWAASNDDDNP